MLLVVLYSVLVILICAASEHNFSFNRTFIVAPPDRTGIHRTIRIFSDSENPCNSNSDVLLTENLVKNCEYLVNNILRDDSDVNESIAVIDDMSNPPDYEILLYSSHHVTDTSKLKFRLYLNSDEAVGTREFIISWMKESFDEKYLHNLPSLAAHFFPEFNLKLQEDTSFIDQLNEAVADDSVFRTFKASSAYTSSKSFHDMWHVFFNAWSTAERRMNLARLCSTHLRVTQPRLHSYIPLMGALDSVGSPDALDYHMFGIHTGEEVYYEDAELYNPAGDGKTIVQIGPVQLRYLLEVDLILTEISPSGLDGLNILEIGGGYGGMAVTLQTLYGISSYVIVDIESAGRLQQKYVSAVSSFLRDNVSDALLPDYMSEADRRELLSRGYHVETVSSGSNLSRESDLLVSFFVLAELKSSVVEKYVGLYVAHAKRGYIQLSFDDPFIDDQYIIERDMLFPMQIFKKVLKHHPKAVMLGPPYAYDHVRIKW